MSGTLPEIPGATPPDPKLKSMWSLGIGAASLVLGFVFLVPVIGLILGIVALRTEPEGQRLAFGGVVLSVVALITWAIFVGPILELIGFSG
ncbi:MAG: hypothetical protein ABW040_05285 [Microbacteriaceae bacterium]